MRNYSKLSRIALPAAVLFASFSSIFIRMSTAPSLIIAFYRMGFSFLLVAPFAAAGLARTSGGSPVSSSRLQKGPGSVSGNRVVFLSILSGFFLALHFASWISSLKFTSVASSVVLVNTHPIFVFLISRYIIKERHRAGELVFVTVTVIGSAVLGWGDWAKGTGVLLGDILAIAGALSVGVYMVLGRAVRQTMSLWSYTFSVYGSSAFFLLLMVIGADLPLWPYTSRDFAIFFGLALFCTFFGHSIYNWALKYVGSTYLSMNILLEPVIAGLLAFFFFQEIPTVINGIGAFIVLFGIYGYSRINAGE